MNVKKFKTSLIMAIIASVVHILLIVLNLILLYNTTAIEEIFNQIKLYLANVGISVTDEYLLMVLMVAFTISFAIGLILNILLLTFATINMIQYKASLEDFRSQTKIRIAYIVFLGISIFATPGSALNGLSNFTSFISMVVTIIALVFAIKGHVAFNRLAKESTMTQEYSNCETTSNEEQSPIVEQRREISEEERLYQEKIKKERAEKAEKSYELLAKLEKDHMRGLINDEDYQRMKKTIFDNLND